MSDKPASPPAKKQSIPLTGLAAAAQEELRRRSGSSWGPLTDYYAEVSQKTLRKALVAAASERAVSGRGVYVRFSAGSPVAHFSWDDDKLSVSLAHADGKVIKSFAWGYRKNAAQVLADMAEALRHELLTAASDEAVSGSILVGVARLVQAGMEARVGAPPEGAPFDAFGSVPAQLGPIVELINDDWAVTEFGLEHLKRHFVVSPDVLAAGDAEGRIVEQEWIDADRAEHALKVVAWYFPASQRAVDEDV